MVSLLQQPKLTRTLAEGSAPHLCTLGPRLQEHALLGAPKFSTLK